MLGYQETQPDRADVDALPGPVVLDFGTNWCGYCRNAAPRVDAALRERSDIRHVRVEDGRGRPLGRSFRVKLWPTLIFLLDGVEVTRLVRPADGQAVRDAVALLDLQSR